MIPLRLRTRPLTEAEKEANRVEFRAFIGDSTDHEHDWLDVTTLGDRDIREICATCPETRIR